MMRFAARAREGAMACVLGVLLAFASQADEPGALNEAVVAVADKGDAARAEAAGRALREVLVKMSGDRRGVAAHPELLEGAASRAEQYQYRDSESGQQLWFQFDAGGVRELLTRVGLPLWTAERPALLLWQLTEQAGSAAIATASQTDALSAALRATAARRGVSLVLPMIDPAQPAIGAEDIRQGDAARLRAASAAYSAGEIATSVVTQGQDGLWRGRFTLLRGERGQTWVAQGETAEAVAAQGIDQIVDALSAPVAAAATGTTAAVEVRVVGLASLAQMAQVESYLRSLPVLSRVELTRLEPSQVTYRMLANGGPAGAAAAIAAGQLLLPTGAEGVYRLNPTPPATAVGQEPTPATVDGAPAAPAPSPPPEAPAPAAGGAPAVEAAPTL